MRTEGKQPIGSRGYLTLLFRETHYQDRTIRFAQHFSMDAFDHELPASYTKPEHGTSSNLRETSAEPCLT